MANTQNVLAITRYKRFNYSSFRPMPNTYHSLFVRFSMFIYWLKWQPCSIKINLRSWEFIARMHDGISLGWKLMVSFRKESKSYCSAMVICSVEICFKNLNFSLSPSESLFENTKLNESKRAHSKMFSCGKKTCRKSSKLNQLCVSVFFVLLFKLSNVLYEIFKTCPRKPRARATNAWKIQADCHKIKK